MHQRQDTGFLSVQHAFNLNGTPRTALPGVETVRFELAGNGSQVQSLSSQRARVRRDWAHVMNGLRFRTRCTDQAVLKGQILGFAEFEPPRSGEWVWVIGAAVSGSLLFPLLGGLIDARTKATRLKLIRTGME